MGLEVPASRNGNQFYASCYRGKESWVCEAPLLSLARNCSWNWREITGENAEVGYFLAYLLTG